MRFLNWLITLPLAAVAVSFAVSNRDLAGFELWPLPQEVMLPRYLAVLVPLVLGILLGGLIAWLSGARHRRLASQHAREVARLNAELKRLAERQVAVGEAERRAAETERVARAQAAAGSVAMLEKPTPPLLAAGGHGR